MSGNPGSIGDNFRSGFSAGQKLGRMVRSWFTREKFDPPQQQSSAPVSSGRDVSQKSQKDKE
jgi:hypothetical protein